MKGDDTMDTILAIIMALMNIFGGPFEDENANTILRSSIQIVQEYNAGEQSEEESFYEVHQEENRKPSILDYDGNTLYNYYQMKACERLDEFHKNIEEGGI